jgi:negative regulator of flagellin synthesis FlgM
MDTAKVSLAGTMISQATRGSDVRFDKVAALQQAIAVGSYNVSSASLADKLIGALLK